MGQVINLDEVYMDEHADLFNDQGWVYPGTGHTFQLEVTDRLNEVRRIASDASEKGWLGPHPTMPLIVHEVEREAPIPRWSELYPESPVTMWGDYVVHVLEKQRLIEAGFREPPRRPSVPLPRVEASWVEEERREMRGQ